METWYGTEETVGLGDADRALDAARDPGAGPVSIVDDGAAVRRIARSTSPPRGYREREARDGLDALEQARAERADLVLTGVKKPGVGAGALASTVARALGAVRAVSAELGAAVAI